MDKISLQFESHSENNSRAVLLLIFMSIIVILCVLWWKLNNVDAYQCIAIYFLLVCLDTRAKSPSEGL